MGHHGRWLSRLTAAIVAVACGATTSCMPFLHKVDPPTKDQLVPSGSLLGAARHHVHIFFIHGMDPFDWANLAGVRDYVQSLGYIKTHYGQLYHTWQFKEELCRVHEEDPDARFVLIGFSFGANMVRNVALTAKEHDIPIDLLVYLGGNTLKDCDEDKPENALHIVNILATGCIWNGDHLEGADNLNYGDVWHFGSPTHPKTLDVLVEELTKVAGRITVVLREPVPWQPGEEAPTPRPVKPQPTARNDAWDFLKIVPLLDEEKPTAEMKKAAEDSEDK